MRHHLITSSSSPFFKKTYFEQRHFSKQGILTFGSSPPTLSDAGIAENRHADSLPKAGASLPTAIVPCSQLSPKPVTTITTNGNVIILIPISTAKFFQFLRKNWSSLAQCAVRFPAFVAMIIASFSRHTYTGSVKRTLPAAPADTLYWNLMSLTALPPSLHSNPSSALYSDFQPLIP